MNLLKTAFVFGLMHIFSASTLLAQELLYEVLIQEQIENADLIIEGLVVSKASYWNSQQTKIYTINTVDVHKIFKGNAAAQIEIITEGGTVGLMSEMVIPSLNLSPNDEGVFMLQNLNQSFRSEQSYLSMFITYSDTQGFYKYNYSDNTAVNAFNQKLGIEETFYRDIVQLTQTLPLKISNFEVSEKLELFSQNRSINNVTSISPTVSTAGTGSVLTINGTGFAPAGLTGTVSFPDANDGGASFFQALQSEIISWTDTQIQVEIPSRAGSGQVRVNTFIGPVFTPLLRINYAQLNVTSDFTGVETAYQTQHIDQNFIGGMTWQMNSNFNNNVPARDSFIRSFDTWVCQTGINWTIGITTPTNATERDNINIIRFEDGSLLPAGVIGRTTSYWNGCLQGSELNWFVAELDIEYNDDINWNFGLGTPIGSQIDFESVSVHELGHAHQLGHVIDNNQIMFWSVRSGIANRILSEEDIAGANDVQSRSTSNPVCGRSVMTNSNCFLSVSDEFLTENISLFPNPTKDVLNITVRNGIALKDIQIYDLSGKVVLKYFIKEEQLGNNIQLSVSNFSSGMYFVELNGESAKAVKKLLIE